MTAENVAASRALHSAANSGVIARLDRAIQYAAAHRFNHRRLWNTGSPACAGDDTEQAETNPSS
jgi:hypothetical protein